MCQKGTYVADDCNIGAPRTTSCIACEQSLTRKTFIDYGPHMTRKCREDKMSCTEPMIKVGGSATQQSRCDCPDGRRKVGKYFCTPRPVQSTASIQSLPDETSIYTTIVPDFGTTMSDIDSGSADSDLEYSRTVTPVVCGVAILIVLGLIWIIRYIIKRRCPKGFWNAIGIKFRALTCSKQSFRDIERQMQHLEARDTSGDESENEDSGLQCLTNSGQVTRGNQDTCTPASPDVTRQHVMSTVPRVLSETSQASNRADCIRSNDAPQLQEHLVNTIHPEGDDSHATPMRVPASNRADCIRSNDAPHLQEHVVNTMHPEGDDSHATPMRVPQNNPVRIRPSHYSPCCQYISENHKRRRQETFSRIALVINGDDADIMGERLLPEGSNFDDIRKKYPYNTQAKTLAIFKRQIELNPDFCLHNLLHIVEQQMYLKQIVLEEIAVLEN